MFNKHIYVCVYEIIYKFMYYNLEILETIYVETLSIYVCVFMS